MQALADSLADWEAISELDEALTSWLVQGPSTCEQTHSAWEEWDWDWESEEIPAVSAAA